MEKRLWRQNNRPLIDCRLKCFHCQGSRPSHRAKNNLRSRFQEEEAEEEEGEGEEEREGEVGDRVGGRIHIRIPYSSGDEFGPYRTFSMCCVSLSRSAPLGQRQKEICNIVTSVISAGRSFPPPPPPILIIAEVLVSHRWGAVVTAAAAVVAVVRIVRAPVLCPD